MRPCIPELISLKKSDMNPDSRLILTLAHKTRTSRWQAGTSVNADRLGKTFIVGSILHGVMTQESSVWDRFL